MKHLRSKVVGFIVLSLFIHLFFYSGLSFLPASSKVEKKDEIIELVVLPSKKKQLKQIVEQSKKRVNDEVDENAKFLGRHNQKVVRQTRAANTGKFTNQATQGQKGQAQKTAKAKKRPKASAGTLPTLSQLRPRANTTPTASVRPKAGDVSRTSDHLKEVDTGLQTLLSTREFVYYAYYQRIRDKIRLFWEPLIKKKVTKVFKSGRTIASARDRVTQVIIVLNQEGSLINVQVIGESGVRDLDEAAIEAFRAAEPFPNPPRGIVEPDGTIKIRWDFVLEASMNPSEGRKVALRY